ncbi:DMT family transporter [Desulfobacula sp.]|uniref:DMT family transporter n=1 Tax=Desulfobacula sp. TaxID=2593537 RepID=UPI00260290F5|nr:DMT family transporter [Desulfobacula sp.]
MSKSQSATLGILLICFIWGVEFVLIRNAIAVLEPHSFNFIRFGIASLFTGICMRHGNQRDGLNWRLIKRGCFLGILLYLGFTFQTFGLLYTSVSNCAFITSLSVVLVPIVAFFALGDRLRLTTIVGVGIATAGLYFLTVAGDVPFNFGDSLPFVGAAMFALHIVYTGKYSREHGALCLTLVQLITVSVLSLGSVLVSEDWHRLLDIGVVGDPRVLFALFVASILGTSLAVMIQTLAQSHLSSTRVALVFSLEPVFASLAAFLVLKEQLPAAAGVGAVMILTGILLAELPSFSFTSCRSKRVKEKIKGALGFEIDVSL